MGEEVEFEMPDGPNRMLPAKMGDDMGYKRAQVAELPNELKGKGTADSETQGDSKQQNGSADLDAANEENANLKVLLAASEEREAAANKELAGLKKDAAAQKKADKALANASKKAEGDNAADNAPPADSENDSTKTATPTGQQ